MKRVVNYKEALKTGKGYDLKVTLKKGKKGVSLYAKKPIKKESVIAYYKFKVFDMDTYDGFMDGMYQFSVYTKSERISSKLIGDLYEGSLREPMYNVPFWAYFSNEPSGPQTENAYMDVNTKYNFRNRDRLKVGDTVIYRLLALRNIKKGEEICWCYGDAYERDYQASCD